MMIAINYHFQNQNQFAQQSFQLHMKNTLISTQQLASNNQKW